MSGLELYTPVDGIWAYTLFKGLVCLIKYIEGGKLMKDCRTGCHVLCLFGGTSGSSYRLVVRGYPLPGPGLEGCDNAIEALPMNCYFP